MESTMASKTLVLKEKLIEELRKNVKDLERRLEQMQRENGSLEKEMEVKNVELEFYRKSIDTSHRQHFENLQKISKLESDCLRLAKKRYAIPQPYQSLPHECLSNCLQSLRAFEEENKALRKLLMDLDNRSDGSSSVSWANALITELDHFKEEKMKTRETKAARESEMSLMDDFVEVEKLAMELSPSMEIVPVHDPQEEDTDEVYDWLQDVMKAISKEQRISKRSSSDLIQDVRIALGCFDDGLDPNILLKTKDLIQEIKAAGSSDGGDLMEKLIASCSELLEKKVTVSVFLEDVNAALGWILGAFKDNIGESPPEKLNGMELLEDGKSKDMEALEEYKLAVTRSKLHEILQKVASLEIELEHKSQRCEELESSCLELQLVLEGLDGGEIGNQSRRKEKSANNEKIMALPLAQEDKAIQMIIETKNRNSIKRFTLREQIEAENNARAIIIRKPNGSVQASYREMKKGQYVQTRSPYRNLNPKGGKSDGFVGAMVASSGKKQGFNLWRKLLLRKEAGRRRMPQ